MRVTKIQLTQARRAGLLAAVAVYPLSRLAGTLPHPTIDRALVSGTTMGVAYRATVLTAEALRGAAGLVASNPQSRAALTVIEATALAGGAGLIAGRARARARRAAESGDRLSISLSAGGSMAELLTIAAGAGALVALSDFVGAELPENFRPAHPAVLTLGLIAAGAALGVAARHPRFLDHLTLPAPAGTQDTNPEFLQGGSVAMAALRSASVAAVTVAALTLETQAAEFIGRELTGDNEPGALAEIAGHAIIASAVALTGLAGFAFYSSRIEVQERVLEAAYAAVPDRRGVSGGPDSVYQFADLGREGRRFVAQAYTSAELTANLGIDTADPVRVFLPLSALTGDADRDAIFVVAEIERLGGFAKGTIVLSAPTGDGYVSYVHTEAVEMLTAGDSTTIAVAYANVPSAVAFLRRERAQAAYAVYARAISARAQELNPTARLFTFGESLGSIVALDAFGPDIVDQLSEIGVSGSLYCGVSVYSRTDRELRPRDPNTRESLGLQYVTGREQALVAAPGHLNLTHPTDPVALSDVTTLVRHPVDYWGRPHGVHMPLVSFLVHLFDVKNAMNLRPGDFLPSPGHDYRFDTAAATARAYGLSFELEDKIETALRERELAWSVRRLLSKRLDDARDGALLKLRAWGVDPETLGSRFNIAPESLPAWLQTPSPLVDAADDYLG